MTETNILGLLERKLCCSKNFVVSVVLISVL